MADSTPQNPFFEPLSLFFSEIEAKGLKIRDATYQARRIEYCKGTEFEEFVKNNLEYVTKRIKEITNQELGTNFMQVLFEIFIKENIFIKLRKSGEDNRKFPKKLYDDKNQESFEDDKFYLVNAKRSQKTTYFYLILAVSVVLLACLFPVWPLELKLTLWWISLILLIFLTGTICIRLIVYILFYTFGYDVWIFPDLLNEKLGFFESFYKLISTNKRNDQLYKIIIRIGLCLSTLYLIYFVYSNPVVIDDALAEFYKIYNDTLSWGNDKIINYHNGTAVSIVNKHDEHLKRILEEGIDD